MVLVVPGRAASWGVRGASLCTSHGFVQQMPLGPQKSKERGGGPGKADLGLELDRWSRVWLTLGQAIATPPQVHPGQVSPRKQEACSWRDCQGPDGHPVKPQMGVCLAIESRGLKDLSTHHSPPVLRGLQLEGSPPPQVGRTDRELGELKGHVSL